MFICASDDSTASSSPWKQDFFMALLWVCSWFLCLAATEGPVKAQQLAIPECFAFIKVEMAAAASSSASGQKPECHLFIVSPPPGGDRCTVFFGFYFEGGSIQFEFEQFCVGLIIPIFIIACLSCARLSSRGRYGQNERGRMDNGGLQMDLNMKNTAGRDLHCGTLQGSSRSYDHNESWHRSVHLLGSHRSPV